MLMTEPRRWPVIMARAAAWAQKNPPLAGGSQTCDGPRRELCRLATNMLRSRPELIAEGVNGQGSWALAEHRHGDSRRGADRRLRVGHLDRAQRPLTGPLRPPLLAPSPCSATIPPF